MRARVSPEDLAGGSLVQPGWYDTEVTDYTESPAATDQSTNGFFHLRVTSDGEFKGAKCRHMVNEKAWGYSPNPKLLHAMGGEKKPGIGYDIDIKKDVVVGKKFRAYWGRTTGKNGVEYNSVQDFARMGEI